MVVTSKMRKTLFAIIVVCSFVSANAQFVDKEFQKFQMAWNIISTFYVDSVNKQQLAEEALVAMLKKLDPHSVYITAKEVEAMNEPLNGSFEGVGIEFNIMNDTLLVVNTIPGGPSEKVGLKAGDRIVAIDSKSITGIGLKNSDVFKMLRGPKGTIVHLTVSRKESKQQTVFKVTRDQIPIFSIDAAYMATPQIGYIKINRFAANTSEEFTTALKKLQKSSPSGLIIDLRGNGGGYFNAAIEIADELLSNKKLITFTQGMASSRRDFHATSKGLFEKGQIVILIDEGSASASEIIAGAIQDHDRGIIIGRRSFGKGLVQRPFTLPDGSAMRLTTAKYYTPSGRSIQKPYDEGNDAYYADLYNRAVHGEFMHSDSIKHNTSAQYKTLDKKRVVFGGGGIMPDIFIPADTSMYSNYYRELISKGVLNRAAFTYIDNNRTEILKLYPDFDIFNKKFEVNMSDIDQIIALAENEKIAFNEQEFKISERIIKIQFKAIIANGLWNTSAYYEVINPLVNTYNKAIELLSNKEEYNNKLK